MVARGLGLVWGVSEGAGNFRPYSLCVFILALLGPQLIVFILTPGGTGGTLCELGDPMKGLGNGEGGVCKRDNCGTGPSFWSPDSSSYSAS